MNKNAVTFLKVFLIGLALLGAVAVGSPAGAAVDPAGNLTNLSLRQAIEMALQYSQKYRLAVGEVNLALDKKAQAHSGYLPQINLSGGVSRLNDQPDLVKLGRSLADLNNALDEWAELMALANPGDPYYAALAQGLTREEGPDDGLTYYSVRLRLEQPLYTGGKLTALNAQAEANLAAARDNLIRAEQDLVFEVTKAYYTVLQAQHLTDTLREAVAGMESHLREAEQYYEAGAVAKLDVLRAEVKLADLRQNELAARNGLQLALANLKFVMGVKTDAALELTEEPASAGLDLDLRTCQERALNQRADLRAWEAKAELGANAVKVAQSGAKPTVGLVFDCDHTTTDLFSQEADLSLAVLATFKLSDGGLVKNQVAEARHQLEQINAARALNQDGVRLEVEQAYNNLQNTAATVQVAEKNLGQAEEALRIAKISYQAGLITSLERIDAETGLTKAKNDYNQALNECHIAVAWLKHAMGE